ncbi:MAG TPA: metal-dependent transcriptional regulator [Bacillota bacterium]|nr:metal-dependent transcriptional regulator [Bacillota bacterium]HPT87221.1 metal-dependent transcriptional regulator [Bacillota bacterium]
MADDMVISPSLENYLEVILELTGEDGKVRVTDLAEKMNVAKSSVNQAVKKLQELELLEHEHYGPLVLTPGGREKALRITRRHKVLTHFFHAVLGVDAQTAEEDACRIEHYLSPTTMERLVDFVETKFKE